MATNALVSIVAGPVFGVLVDRFGGRRMLAVSLAILTVGYAMYPLVHEAWHALFIFAGFSGFELCPCMRRTRRR